MTRTFKELDNCRAVLPLGKSLGYSIYDGHGRYIGIFWPNYSPIVIGEVILIAEDGAVIRTGVCFPYDEQRGLFQAVRYCYLRTLKPKTNSRIRIAWDNFRIWFLKLYVKISQSL